jgi:hypothetical protein
MLKKTLLTVIAFSFAGAWTAQADLLSFTGTVYHDPGNLLSASVAASDPGNSTIGTFTGSSSISFNITSPYGSSTPMSSFFTGVTNSSALTSSVWWNRVMTDPTDIFGNGIYSTGVVIDGTASFQAGDTITIQHDDGVILSLQGLGNVISNAGPTVSVSDSYTFTQNFTGTFDLEYMATNSNPSILDVTTMHATPEPSSVTLLGAGLIAGAGFLRRKYRTR